MPVIKGLSRLFPYLVLCALALAGVVLTEILVRQELESAQRQASDKALERLYALRVRIESELISTLHLASGIEAFIRANRGQVRGEEMQRVLAVLHSRSQSVRNMGIAPGNRIAHVYPLAGNEKAIGLYYPDNPLQWPAIEKVIRQREAFLAGPVQLEQGGEGLIYRQPVFLDDGKYWGVISTVIDTARLWQRVGLVEAASSRFSILGKDALGERGEPVFGARREAAFGIDIAIPGGSWRLQEAILPADHADAMGWRAAGWLASLLLALGVFHILRSAQRLGALNAELAASRDAAEAASRARGAFLAVMSHELRTPLNGVMGMTELLLSSSLSPVQADYARTARSCAGALLASMDDILDFSLIDSGALVLRQDEFALIPLLEDTAEPFALKACDKGLEFSWIISPALPAMALGDSVRLRQIVSHLLSNAVKFTDSGSVILSVSVDEQDPRCLLLTVRDTGIGITQEQQSRLFETFSQLDSSATRRFGGTGLGLALCRRLLGLMGGSIRVESQPGQGACFHVSVPLGLRAPDVQPSLPWPSAGAVMLVSPSSTLRAGLDVWLTAWGGKPSLFADGDEALRELERLSTLSVWPDLLIVDSASMPGGEALLARLESDGRLQGCACIRLLAPGTLPAAPQGGGNRRTALLGKPVRPASLARVITELFTPPPPQPTTRTGESRGLAAWRILLVEDNLINQKVALAMLGMLGLQADTAFNGREALTALSRSDYDLVLMDLQMPEMDGLEAVRQIRDPSSSVRRHDLPVVALTANALEIHREECLAAGMDEYLSKPLSQDALCAVLRQFLPGFAHPPA